MSAPVAVILTSAVGLGVYIPALLIQGRLRQQGLVVRCEVLEDYYTASRQQSHIAHGEAHHADFALAQLAHRMARDVQGCLDGERLQTLLADWARQGCRHFMVWSGFWLPILARYQAQTGWALEIDHCRIDAEMSASFRVHADLAAQGREIWLWHGDAGRLVHEIPVGSAPPLPWQQRQARLTVHGGGWGIGTYQARAEALAQAGFALDRVIHTEAEATVARPGDACFLLQPGWRAWHRDAAGELQFPAMGEVTASRETLYLRRAQYHVLYDVIRRNQAIVSKPGGCTLIDSLASATPVVLLEPYGYAEARNADIWLQLGFGIRYEDWRDSGFDPALLAQLHHNLLAHAGRGTDYPQAYAARLLQEQAA
ncbi:hypothetical protein QWZ03_17405 [Chitinimonas viridis]|uniref:UDP-glucuronosyltransferase n=1 Tax=Chitinimonas viridis TaxID=664880 RepID=A0ABT8BAA4_9NEIS|nr:hypothetical protein [Chitinimonas viridis]MDN3578546.1 hypothetical protein [Chitinimonas viridis]